VSAFSIHFLPYVRESGFRNQWNFSLRSWRYCVGARLKFWRRSRVPKKGVGTRRLKCISRGFAARDGFAVKSHSTILQRLRRQISLDYYTILPATQASEIYALGIEIQGFAIANTAQRSWNLINDWNPESKFHWQRPESSTPGIRTLRRGIRRGNRATFLYTSTSKSETLIHSSIFLS